MQVLNQDETPLLYSLVFGEGVVNDATSVVIFNAVQNFDLTRITTSDAFHLIGNFFYLFITSTVLGAGVSLSFSFLTFGDLSKFLHISMLNEHEMLSWKI